MKYKLGIQVLVGIVLAVVGIYFKWLPFQGVFQQWATMQHECFHAIASYLTGGGVARIEIHPDGSGLAFTTGGIYPIISLAGYMGTSAYAGSLLYFGTKKSGVQYFAVTQSIIMTVLALNAYLSLIAWMLITISVVLVVVTWRFNTVVPVVFSAGLLFFESLSDISVLTSKIVHQSDAAMLAQYWNMPFLTYPLAGAHIVFTLCVWFATLWILLKRGYKAGLNKTAY